MSVTSRLYYTDAYLTHFTAKVVDADAARTRIYLDQTAFYPASGGQPYDLGTLGGISIREVIDEGDRIAHDLTAPLALEQVRGQIDWTRRFDHMQQHTGQHLLSAVFAEQLGAETVSIHLGAESSTIDLAVPQLGAAQIQEVERRANELVFENRPVAIQFAEAPEVKDLRKASTREGTLRIVSIASLDRSACGGTHVRSTAEIGPILVRKLEKIRTLLRVEFLCGSRAVKRARADYQALSEIARAFSASIDETPSLVLAQITKAADADKARRKLSLELATARGRELYASTRAEECGLRSTVRTVEAISEEVRAEAQSFAQGLKARLLVVTRNPPAVLVAASADSGLDAGQWLKPLLAAAGGRGGGNSSLAQGSLPSPDALEGLIQAFQECLMAYIENAKPD